MLGVYQAQELVAEQALEFTGVEDEFAGRVVLPGGGDFELEVTASQHSTGNAGVYRHPLRVSAATP
ncbi:MAG: hypothetical protein NWR12_12540 [Haliea sp.]|nr:hypothetical protein [Haliea sp.]MDP4918535.1 hypothetical protein [Haliea sp.]